MHRIVPTVATALLLASVGGTEVAAQEDGGPIAATTEDGTAVLLFDDGTWSRANADGDGTEIPEEQSDDPEAPAVLSVQELINEARDRIGESVSVNGQIRCFSEADCDIISEDGAFYTRENVSVATEGLTLEQRQELTRECGRFDPRCPVTVVGTIDFTRYDALVIRAESVER